MKRRSKFNLFALALAGLVATLLVGTVFAWSYEKDQTPTEIIDPANNSDPIDEIIFDTGDPVSAIDTATLEFCAEGAVVDLNCDGTVLGSDIATPSGTSLSDVEPDGDVDLVVTFVPPGNWGEVFPPGTTRACVTAALKEPPDGPGGGERLTAAGHPHVPLCQDLVLIDGGGGEGCTPGFWKVKPHQPLWDVRSASADDDPGDFITTDDFDTVFGRNVFGGTKTLLDAVRFNGNDFNSLVRHTVAGLLNASSPDVSYDLTVAEVIAIFQDAFDSNTSAAFRAAKDTLEGFNDQDNCPL